MSTHSILSAVFKCSSLNESVSPPGVNRALDHLDFINRQMVNKEVPIEVDEPTWETVHYSDHESIEKTYTFSDFNHLLYFVSEVLISSKSFGHDPILNIDHDQVGVKLYTRDINEITELDIKFSKIVDEIFEDIFYVETK